MSETSQDRYDAATQTLWLFRDYADPYTLVPNEELMAVSKAVRDGAWSGKPLRRAGYIFAHEDSAEYNHHALSFARVGTFVGSLDAPKPYDSDDDATFDTREDFGIS